MVLTRPWDSRANRSAWREDFQGWGIRSMEQITADTGEASSTERLAWEAPRLTVVVPLDRTMAGTIVDIGEGIGYKVS